MFTWLNKQGVASDDGFEVQFTGRFDLEYRESGRVLLIDIEGVYVGGSSLISMDPASIQRWGDGRGIG